MRPFFAAVWETVAFRVRRRFLPTVATMPHVLPQRPADFIAPVCKLKRLCNRIMAVGFTEHVRHEIEGPVRNGHSGNRGGRDVAGAPVRTELRCARSSSWWSAALRSDVTANPDRRVEDGEWLRFAYNGDLSRNFGDGAPLERARVRSGQGLVQQGAPRRCSGAQTSLREPMTDLEIIGSAEVPGWPFIFVVGSYDKRITFYSQQVRALNLAAALSASGRLNGKWRLAVVGAGAAGVSLSAALALLRNDAQIDLYEREQDILHLQRDCRRRNLHPHIYDWPEMAASSPNAGLPILDWNSGNAHDVSEQVTRHFELIRGQLTARLRLRNLRSVIGLQRVDAEYQLSHRGTDAIIASDNYHAVFLTIGFGFERAIAGVSSRSYWS